MDMEECKPFGLTIELKCRCGDDGKWAGQPRVVGEHVEAWQKRHDGCRGWREEEEELFKDIDKLVEALKPISKPSTQGMADNSAVPAYLKVIRSCYTCKHGNALTQKPSDKPPCEGCNTRELSKWEAKAEVESRRCFECKHLDGYRAICSGCFRDMRSPLAGGKAFHVEQRRDLWEAKAQPAYATQCTGCKYEKQSRDSRSCDACRLNPAASGYAPVRYVKA